MNLTDAASCDYGVSIAIPTRNAGALLSRTVAALDCQITENRIERIALDSGSNDDTLELLQQSGFRIITMTPAAFDWGAVRQRLFEESHAPIVVHLSQDAVPAHEHWLENLIRPLKDDGVAVSCGSSIPDPDRAFPQFQWERNGYYYFTREIKKFTAQYGKGLSFANTAVRRSVWEKLGIDPQATGEDFQFQMKLHGTGQRIVFPNDAPVLHHHDYTLRAVFRRCRNEGLALRGMGCPYHEADLLIDLASPAKYIQWLRELKRGSLRTSAEWLYPVVRPLAVYAGSRFAKVYRWY